MDEVLHANIFFLITSVMTVIFFIIVSVVTYQVFKILKLVRSILERVESASEVVAEDVAEFRAALKEGGWFGKIISFVLSSAGNVSSGKRTRKK
jgi:hypothetical protein